MRIEILKDQNGHSIPFNYKTTSNYYIVVSIMYFIVFIITILNAFFSEICFVCIDLFIFLLLIDFMCAAIAFAMIIIGIRRNTFNSQGKPVFEDNFLSINTFFSYFESKKNSKYSIFIKFFNTHIICL